jgi:cytosine/adenosine deaminase-related metal-dependent hydrolase
MGHIAFRHCRYLVCRADPAGGIIEDGAVLVKGSRIADVGPGKRADIITIDLRRDTSLFPLGRESLFSILTLNGAGLEARDVLVDGVFVRRNGVFTRLDEEAILARAREWCAKFEGCYKASMRAGRAMFPRVTE